MSAHLIVISGLPGVRKTSVAVAVAARTGAVHLSIDAVNDSEEARHTPYRAAAAGDGDLTFVHLVTRDWAEHERRLTSRDRGFAQIPEPTWAEVQVRRADYVP